jgi:hypothetical protein
VKIADEHRIRAGERQLHFLDHAPNVFPASESLALHLLVEDFPIKSVDFPLDSRAFSVHPFGLGTNIDPVIEGEKRCDEQGHKIAEQENENPLIFSMAVPLSARCDSSQISCMKIHDVRLPLSLIHGSRAGSIFSITLNFADAALEFRAISSAPGRIGLRVTS